MKNKIIFVLGLVMIGIFSKTVFLSVSRAYAETKKQLYTCPMHPHVKSEQPGECPICHMTLVPIQDGSKSDAQSSTSSSEKKIKFYRNPMNPAITSKSPAKDEMGMEYIPVYEDDSKTNTESLNGRSSFKLSSAQAENLNLNTLKVVTKNLSEKLKASARVLGGSSIAIQVIEADALKVKKGQSFIFKSLSQNTEFRGKIVGVDSALDPMSRTVRVTGSLSGNSGLRSESSGTAVIDIDMGSGLFVPENSVLRTGEDDLIYVVSNNQITPRKIKLGAKVDGGFQILSGVQADEEISTGPNFLLDSEARIQGAHD